MTGEFAFLDDAVAAQLQAAGVRAADVEERFVRGAGPGGQKINKTSSTVWLRHGPTGIEVRCQRERSQARNRALAWLELAGRIAGAADAVRAEKRQVREQARRRTRQKSRAQKARMVETKRRRTKQKTQRGRVADE
ncbi:peptide chain release factor family protein [Horticoccus luteus]|uniref:peptide chain release factor family protein n=1 Tax=Horticoccus luteus TaxID=2862869 RepID=UPI0021033A78|nr:peptide chain release factor-like protein [Horticoccus luteus]